MSFGKTRPAWSRSLEKTCARRDAAREGVVEENTIWYAVKREKPEVKQNLAVAISSRTGRARPARRSLLFSEPWTSLQSGESVECRALPRHSHSPASAAGSEVGDDGSCPRHPPLPPPACLPFASGLGPTSSSSTSPPTTSISPPRKCWSKPSRTSKAR